MTFLQQADHLVRHHPANKELMELERGCQINRQFDEYQGGTIIGQDNGTYYVCIDPIGGNVVMAYDIQQHEIIGKPPQLQHYLRVLGEQNTHDFRMDKHGSVWFKGDTVYDDTRITFNLTTGAPASEADAEAFIKLVS